MMYKVLSVSEDEVATTETQINWYSTITHKLHSMFQFELEKY